MKSSLAFAIAFFFLGYATNAWLSYSSKEISESRVQIQKEAVTSAVKLSELSPSLQHEDLNRNIRPKTPASVVNRSPASTPSSGPNSISPQSDEFVTTLPNGEELWCYPNPNQGAEVDRHTLVCTYPKACFSCLGSRILVPEIKTAQPLCSNGKEASLKTAICCSHDREQGTQGCPELRACFESNESTDHCTDDLHRNL